MIIFGTDPGVNGGMSCLHTTDIREVIGVDTLKFSTVTEYGIWEWVQRMRTLPYSHPTHSYVETQAVRPTDRRTNVAKLHHQWGMLRAFFIATEEIQLHAVRPQEWQKEFKLIVPKTWSHTKKKNLHKQRAEELFPGIKVTHAIADALLIAEWGRRQV